MVSNLSKGQTRTRFELYWYAFVTDPFERIGGIIFLINRGSGARVIHRFMVMFENDRVVAWEGSPIDEKSETLKCLHENIRRFNNLESKPVDLILSGASGRMGREILKLVMGNDKFRLIGALENENCVEIGQDAVRFIGQSCGIKITDNADSISFKSQII